MRLTRTLTFVTGVLTAALLIWIAVLVGYFNPRVWAGAQGGLGQTAEFRALSDLVFWLGVGGGLFAMLLWAFYLFYAQVGDSVPAKARVRWRWILLLASLVAMPVFWYLYMWRPSVQRYSALAAGSGRSG